MNRIRLTKSIAYGLALLVSFLLTTYISHAQTKESAAALENVAQAVRYHVLPNGLRVIMYSRKSAPIFSGVVAVRVGGVDEQVGETGISHLLEHMAFKGSPVIGTSDYAKEKLLLARLEELVATQQAGEVPDEKWQAEWDTIHKKLADIWVDEEFIKEYRLRGASGLNATTGKELTNYMTSLPKSAFEFWCWMESERLLRPVMRQFYQERDVVMEERRMRYDNSPTGKLYEQLLSASYSVHPYRNPVIGYPFDINKLTAAQTEEFRKVYYVPSNIILSLVGDLDYDNDLALIEKYFGRIESGAAPPRSTIVEPVQTGERQISYESPASSEVFIAYKKPTYPHPDDPVLGVMTELLASGSLSPLYKELVEKTRVASDVGADEIPGIGYPNMILFYLSPKAPHSNKEAIKVFDRVISDFKNGTGLSEERLAIAKRIIAMEYLLLLKSNMSMAIHLASSELLFNDWKASLDWYEKAMQVELEDISTIAKKYLNSNTRTIAQIKTKKG